MICFENDVNNAIWKIVLETTTSLTGKKQLEDEVKKTLTPQVQQAPWGKQTTNYNWITK